MALFSFLKRKNGPPRDAAQPTNAPSLDEGMAPEQQARAQARRRLIGAVVLLALGVLLFPLVFETQPRPMPADIPVEMPHREAAATRAAPARQVPAPLPPAPVAEPVASAPAAAAAPPTPEASAPVVEPARAVPAAPASDAAPARAPASAAPATAERPAKVASAPRASAPAAASEPRGGRFVVQVGAYTDAGTLRDVRAKVEKLGLKTYTQAVETEQGTRTRVRVGPFATRQEAEAASTRLKGAGLPGNVLVL